MNSIVIGSGFGGIASALRLRAKNHNVTLIEKHNDLGGRARVFKKNGFKYGSWPQVGSPKSRKMDPQNNIFFRRDSTSIFIALGLKCSMFF